MPCGTVCICGISSRFQLLSPCAGQVIHALLTRPPLSRLRLPPEGFCRRRFVRLACVRHAASVHPEPGSNSHLNVCFLTGSRLAFALLFLSVLPFLGFTFHLRKMIRSLKFQLNFQGCFTVWLSKFCCCKPFILLLVCFFIATSLRCGNE